MSKTKRIQNKRNSSGALLLTLVCVVALALVGVIVALVIVLQPKEKEIAEFVPPEFDSGAIEGMPSEADTAELGYSELYRDGMAFSASVCGAVNIEDGKADIYFTNPEKNTLWMKLRVFDESGRIIAETGLIKPNEYVKTITFSTVPANGSKIRMKIMTYEPDTYYSGGAVSMTTVANVK